MAENFLFFQGKKLAYVSDVKPFIDENNILKADLFNNKGAILAKQGQKAPEKIFKIPIYTYVSAYEEFSKLPSFPPRTDTIKPASEILIEKKATLVEKVGARTIEIYTQTNDHLETLFTDTTQQKQRINDSWEMIESNFKLEFKDLHHCISELRDKDTYTTNHSYSVWLMFIEALRDFKKYIEHDIFWDTFKPSHSSISFNDQAIKKYSIGALFHDLGKVNIPIEIINKPGKLNDKETEIMNNHPKFGVEMLEKADINEIHILQIVANHHGRYPYYKDQISSPLTVIANVIDIFDACTSERSYKPPFSFDETIAILRKEQNALQWNEFIFNTLLKDTLPKFNKDAINRGKGILL